MIMDFMATAIRATSRICAGRVTRVFSRAPCAVGSRLPVDPQRGSERTIRRPLDAGVSEAGVLVDGRPTRATGTRNIRNTARSTASATRRDVRAGSAQGQLHVRTLPGRKDRPGFQTRFRHSFFRDASYLGAGWKALPCDLSSPRLGNRAFDLVDGLNNQGLRKRLLGEVDVFQFDRRASSTRT